MPDILVDSTHCSWLLDDIGIPIGIQTPQGVKQYFTKSPAKNIVVDPAMQAVFAKDTNGNITGLQNPAGGVVALGGSRSPYKTPLKVGFAGDSIMNYAGNGSLSVTAGGASTSFMFWLVAREYPCEINWDYNIAVGGTTMPQILSGQLPLIVANPPDLLFLNGGTNDNTCTAATMQAAKDMITGCLAAGVYTVVFFPITPRTGSIASKNLSIANFNNVIKAFCKQTPGAFYIDHISQSLDPASTTYIPVGGSTGVVGSTTFDGLHPAVVQSQRVAKLVAPILQKLAKPRVARAVNQLDVFDAVNNASGNLFGAAGLFQGTNGLFSGVANLNVAALWEATPSNGITATPSIVTSSYIAGGYKAQRFDLSGTATVDDVCLRFKYSQYAPANFANAPKFDAEVIVRNGLTGSSGIGFNCRADGSGPVVLAPTVGGAKYPGTAAGDIPTKDEFLFLALKGPIQTNALGQYFEMDIYVYGRTGQAISGFIEIQNAGVFADSSSVFVA